MKISELNPYTFKALRPVVQARIAGQAARRLILHPDGELVRRHCSVASAFCRSVVSMGYLTQAQMDHAARCYHLGLSRDGGVIFWQIDPLHQVCDGKIMYYRPDCHRDHDRMPTWVSAELRAFYLADAPQCSAALHTAHCLFGTHLLAATDKPVAVVEAEKTAVVMSELYPDYVWLAAGGMNELTAQKLFPLRDRRIVLMPDTDEHHQAFTVWFRVCREAERLLGHPVHLSPFLEQHASRDQKRRKIDILDYYLEDVIRLNPPPNQPLSTGNSG